MISSIWAEPNAGLRHPALSYLTYTDIEKRIVEGSACQHEEAHGTIAEEGSEVRKLKKSIHTYGSVREAEILRSKRSASKTRFIMCVVMFNSLQGFGWASKLRR